MPSSKVDIWNMAISHLAESVEVQSETENTAAARACRRFYDVCRRETLRGADWPFAKAYVPLANITLTIPQTEYLYAYRYPVDALRVRRILNGLSRIENMQTRVMYKIGQDASGKILFCDVQPYANATDATQSVPWLEYTVDITDTTKFDDDFVIGLSYLLAFRIGPRICGDKSKLIADAFTMWQKYMRQAQINAINEQAPDDIPPSEFERSRWGEPQPIDSQRRFDWPSQ